MAAKMVGIAVRVVRCVAVCLVAGTLLHPHSGAARTRSHKQQHPTILHAQPPEMHHRGYAERKPRATATHARSSKTKRVAKSPPRHPANLANRPLIVIDPGHGGRDPGAIGASGTQEKMVTLATALELRRLLEATGRYRVALTRTRDVTVSLNNRLAFARKHEADLLIAIHADASHNRKARGASVYVRSGHSSAHLLASRRNANRIASALRAPDPVPEATSAFLQFSMIEQLDDDVRMAATPARSAHFYVLASRETPSVLLEMGFLSNRQDEALLRQPAHRLVIVRAVRDAIDDYFSHIRSAGPRT